MPQGTWAPSRSGPAGATGPQGPAGPTGPQGPPGVGFTIKGTVATVGALPASGNSVGDAYKVTGTGDIHSWNGSAWINLGPIQGPQGPTGPQGPQGTAGATGSQGPTGAAGTNGVGVPTGGTTGQVLAKSSATDYATTWVTPTAGTGGGTGTVTAVNGQPPDGTGNVALTLDLTDTTTTSGQLDASSKLANLQEAVGSFMTQSTDPNGDTVARRRPTGTISAASAVGNDEVPPLQQVRSLVAAVTPGGGVNSPRSKDSLPLASNTDGTFKDGPARLNLTGARSGERYRCGLWVCFRGTGIKWQQKSAAAAVTNRLPNPAANTDVAGWNIANGTVTRETTTTQEGPGAFRIECTSAGTVSFYSNWSTGVAETHVYSAAAQVRRSTATARNVRVDVQFGDSTAVDGNLSTGVLSSFLGAVQSPGTTAYVRALSDSANRSGTATGAAIAPAGTTKVRVRVVILTAAVGDIFFADAIQLEPSDPVPAYGNTGGGSTTVDTQGSFLGYPASGTITAATSPQVPVTIRTGGTNAAVAATMQGLGTATDAEFTANFDVLFGGTGLTDQTFGWEFAALATANTTNIVAAWATWAKVESPA